MNPPPDQMPLGDPSPGRLTVDQGLPSSARDEALL